MKPSLVIFLIIIYVSVAPQLPVVMGLPLSTNSRWIVNEAGTRVKFQCVNWPSHLETVLAEGLNKRSVGDISEHIGAMGFNCVRFTWPLDLAINDTLASTTVEERFKSLGLDEAFNGIQAHNPEFLNLTIIEAYQEVITKLGDKNIMVILDNHISTPGWCCNTEDKNGFFGEPFFNPQLWLTGLSKMASLFKNTGNVVGMSLRNELRGPKQDIGAWFKYMQEGAETVHKANPNVLVVLSGLTYDTSLSFLKRKAVKLSFEKKLVFEIHRYGFTDGSAWELGNPNKVCGKFTAHFMNTAGFLLEKGFPLFLSEFGGDLRETNVNDNRFFNCMFGILVDLDLDWAMWALQGSYYLREGAKDTDEVYGVYDQAWKGDRNKKFMARLKSIQIPYQGPIESVAPYNIIYHSSTGLCVLNDAESEGMKLGMCEESNPWNYNVEHKTIMKKGTKYCLEAVGMEEPIKLGTNCNSPSSKWEMISRSKLHISTRLKKGKRVCMDVKNGVIISSMCSCLNDDDPQCDPGVQWFKIIHSRRSPSASKTSLDV